jgi:3',5'-cyclic AMP phosphodiesterase CpdA
VRIAVVSDVHGNLAALEAVLADLELLAPDLVAHGGDLAFNGPRPAECVDRIRELGWPGVVGNTEEALWTTENIFRAVRPMFELRVPSTLVLLGEDRVWWLRCLPPEWRSGNGLVLVHAAPGNLWRAPGADAKDDELLASGYPDADILAEGARAGRLVRRG